MGTVGRTAQTRKYTCMNALPLETEFPRHDAISQQINWPLAAASLEGVLADHSVRRSTRLADLIEQTATLLDAARRNRQPQLANALDRLIHAIEREQVTASEDFSRLIRLIRHIERIIQNSAVLDANGNNPLALILTETEPSETLRDALNRAGYAVQIINPLTADQQQIKALCEEAELLVFITHRSESAQEIMAPVARFEALIKSRTTIMIAANDSFASRAAAVKTGVTHFLTEPLDVSRLNTLLQSARMTDEENRPLRVLMVDDMATAGVYWGKHFQRHNIFYRFETSPEKAYRSAIEMEPDIILLDLYMPDIDGIDLARIFREHPRLQDVPILFMSTEENDRRRMEAKIQGGDDFLNKTIPIDDLLKMVRYRALRYRQSSAEKRSDSLTGLLNHNAIKHLIESELDRANRQNQPLTVAMIDIDHFKKVNDNYGHQIGDNVIRKLSNLLNTRLRRYDGVGRYGGEEFLVALPNTDETTAAHLINRLRIQFANTPIQIEDKTKVQCTFSAGIASFPNSLDLTSLIEAADNNLYLAKDHGRNRVICDQFSRTQPDTGGR